MKVIKRDGQFVDYDRKKIISAIEKANSEVDFSEKATKAEIDEIIEGIESLGLEKISVEDIQDIIEKSLMELDRQELSKKYIIYRYKRELVRKANTTDKTIKELLEGDSEYWNTDMKQIMLNFDMDDLPFEMMPDAVDLANTEQILNNILEWN